MAMYPQTKIVSNKLSQRTSSVCTGKNAFGMASLNNSHGHHPRKGAMVILLCIMMFAFLVTVAFSVDIAYMYLVRSELRSATDAATKAASVTLSRTEDIAESIRVGKRIAESNTVGGKPLILNDSDFEFGRATQASAGSKFSFVRNASPINSVRVVASRTAKSSGGSVGLFLGRIFSSPAFEPTEVTSATFLKRETVLVVDRSGSMSNEGKMNGLKNAVGAYLDFVGKSKQEVRIGLVAYADVAMKVTELTNNHKLVRDKMNAMQPNGTTNIYDGLQKGEEVLFASNSRQFVESSIILLTDGKPVGSLPVLPKAQDLASKGVVIHAISFGKQDVDKVLMRAIAAATGGRYFHADNNGELKKVFEEIALTTASIIFE